MEVIPPIERKKIDFIRCFSILSEANDGLSKEMTMKIGYARKTRGGLTIEQQLELLKQVGCDMFITEQPETGIRDPKLKYTLNRMKNLDVIVVCDIDTLSSSPSKMRKIIGHVESCGADIIILTDHIDTDRGYLMLYARIYMYTEFYKNTSRKSKNMSLSRNAKIKSPPEWLFI